MKRDIKVFVTPTDRSPGGPPEPAQEMAIEARSIDGLREAARAKLSEEGLRVRSLSFSPDGLVAYVEPGR